jgi:hypothetical protein
MDLGSGGLGGKAMWKKPSQPGDAESPPYTSETVLLTTPPTEVNIHLHAAC